MKIDRVTLTGADDSTDVAELFRISEKYPFVEWGILFSKSACGKKTRYPSKEWLFDLEQKLISSDKDFNVNLSGHICGRWIRDICKGDWSDFINEREGIIRSLRRFQLNFSSYVKSIDETLFINELKVVNLWRYRFAHLSDLVSSIEDKELNNHFQFIFQLKDINEPILSAARSNGIDAVPLFDLSGGAGTLPDEWPEARDFYCGYAGGLSPDNLEEQLKLIEKSVGDRTIWIDAETHVRSDNDKIFDLEKVERFLEIAKPYTE